MQELKDIANRLPIGSDAPTPSSSKPAPDEFKRLVTLWQHMTGIYGHKWVSSFGEEVSETWVRGCRDLSGDELAKGLRGCLSRSQSNRRFGDEDWPPTLGEFRNMCRPVPYPYHNNVPALPAPTLTPEQVREIEADITKLRLEIRANSFKPREPGSDDEPLTRSEP